MIKEEEFGLKHRDYITRVCDDCGDESVRLYGSIKSYRKRRGLEKDYCKKCSYKYRILVQPKMEDSPSWRGGRYLNENGYYRVYTGGLKYEYEHKIIMGDHLGRKLSKKEKVHHIDLDKANNSIDNLYLFDGKSSHAYAHYSLEKCGFLFFGTEIWFNGTTYGFDRCERPIAEVDISDLLSLKTFIAKRRESYLGYYKLTNGKKSKELGSTMLHTLIAERLIGRKLYRDEVVHHINGNSLDNALGNLAVMTRRNHTLCHYSMQELAVQLYKKGLIEFKKGKYHVK